MTSLVLRNYATLFVPGSGLVSGTCVWCSRDKMVSKFITFMREMTVPSFWGSLLCSLKKGHGVMEFIYFEGYCCPLNDEDINGKFLPQKGGMWSCLFTY